MLRQYKYPQILFLSSRSTSGQHAFITPSGEDGEKSATEEQEEYQQTKTNKHLFLKRTWT